MSSSMTHALYATRSISSPCLIRRSYAVRCVCFVEAYLAACNNMQTGGVSFTMTYQMFNPVDAAAPPNCTVGQTPSASSTRRVLMPRLTEEQDEEPKEEEEEPFVVATSDRAPSVKLTCRVNRLFTLMHTVAVSKTT